MCFVCSAGSFVASAFVCGRYSVVYFNGYNSFPKRKKWGMSPPQGGGVADKTFGPITLLWGCGKGVWWWVPVRRLRAITPLGVGSLPAKV